MTIETSSLPPTRHTRLCIVLTCFNRKEKTLACFKALSASTLPAHLTLSAVVVDDGSTDGTTKALSEEFPWVEVVRGEGNLFWARGMHQALRVAMQSDFDFYLWLNDDTMLFDDTISRLIACEALLRKKNDKPVIVVGSTVDELSGVLTYGGEVRISELRKMRFTKVTPSDAPQSCQSMNGNTVLVSRDAAHAVGNIDSAFEHAMGDTDYALRANRLGVGVWVAPGVHGTCSGNALTGTYMDANLPLGRRWKLMMSRKGLPWRSWLVLTKRHAGPIWPLFFAWPYMSLLTGLYRKNEVVKP